MLILVYMMSDSVDSMLILVYMMSDSVDSMLILVYMMSDSVDSMLILVYMMSDSVVSKWLSPFCVQTLVNLCHICSLDPKQTVIVMYKHILHLYIYLAC